MKRIFALMLALMLCCGALCEEFTEDMMDMHAPLLQIGRDAFPANFFSIYGMTWGEKLSGVQILQGSPDNEWSDGRWRELSYGEVSVSNFVADIQMFGFVDEQLRMVAYAFEYADEATARYLTEALAWKYGATLEPDEDRMFSLIEPLMGLSRSEFMPHIMGNWALEDGTFIVSFVYGESYSIFYLDEVGLRRAQGYNIHDL